MPFASPLHVRRHSRRLVAAFRANRWRTAAGAAALVLVATGLAWVVIPTSSGHRTTDQMIEVRTGPDDATNVTLDTTLYLPQSAGPGKKVPAILLAHGFGGTKQTVASDAADYADQGYAVLTWTAQGFGRSTGEVHLDSPDWEVKDAQRLLDWLAARPEIVTQAQGDPRVAVVGASYGGGLALMLAAADKRVDAIVPMITWNDLPRAFFPQGTGDPAETGVFKRQWVGLFFGTGGYDESAIAAGRGLGAGAKTDPQCGRFARDLCEAYLRIAASGQADPEAVALLRRSSPSSVLDQITAPTFLIQGTADSLFPLAEADQNATGIAANGTPVRVAWYVGGHDGGAGPTSDTDRLRALTLQWLDHYLNGHGSAPARNFTYSRVTGFSATERGVVTSAYTVGTYPGSNDPGGGRSTPVTATVTGPVQEIANPPAGNPGAISSLPGAGALSGLASGLTTEVSGQHADFLSAPLSGAIDVVGAPTVQIRVAAQTGVAVVFVKLYDVDQHGASTLPDGLVAPVRLTGLPADLATAEPVTVTLPNIVHRFEAGHRLRVTVASSDQAYATPIEPTVYRVVVAPEVTLPGVLSHPIAASSAVWRYVLAWLIAAVLVGLAAAVGLGRYLARRAGRAVVPEHADTPLVVRGLRKAYADGFVAVSTVDFTVTRGAVVGLLGPNGAGKTTTLRVLMGLTRPTAGEVLIFGNRLVPGAPVLTRVGALVEGPGFLPHLSGLANLQLYWKATGRPEAQGRLSEALDIAGLGEAIHRKVKTYSHGMRQRLAIAQAMLGLPELLVLDEPTDGLDPPQIAEMRIVLRRYATDGRAVLVSSHLLAEVEQTCTEVVVMHKGLVVAAGAVSDIVGDSPTAAFEVSDPIAARKVLEHLACVRSVVPDGVSTLVVEVAGAPRSDLVQALVTAGIGVEKVVPKRRLEDAFLALVGGDTKASGER